LLKKQAERMKTKNLAAADASKSFFAVAACRRRHPFSKTTPFADISNGVAPPSRDDLMQPRWG